MLESSAPLLVVHLHNLLLLVNQRCSRICPIRQRYISCINPSHLAQQPRPFTRSSTTVITLEPKVPKLHSMTGTRKSERTNRGSSQRGGRSRGGGRSAQPRETVVSKALSFLLRHGARGEGIELDDGGWANLADVVSGLRNFFTSLLPFGSSYFSSILRVTFPCRECHSPDAICKKQFLIDLCHM